MTTLQTAREAGEQAAALTQRQRIIRLLKRRWTSPLDALRECGSMKLASRVSELRRQGYVIADKWGPAKSYKLYLLRKAPGK